jgi:peptidoglycan lytic transglycosylase
VTLLSTGRSVVVRVNDRGPFGGGILDLSVRGAREIGLLAAGRGQVTAQVVGQASSPAASRLAFGF